MDQNTLTQAKRHAALAKMHLDLINDNLKPDYPHLAAARTETSGLATKLDAELIERQKTA